MTAKASRHLLQTWSPTVGLSPPQMFLTQTWGTLLQVLVNSSLASICPAPLTLNHCCSNTHLWSPLVLLLDSNGNPSISLSIQFHWPAMTPVLQLRMGPQWQLHCLSQLHTVPAVYTWNITFTVLASITPYWLDWMWYRLMAYALHSMLAQSQTSSKHIFGF